MGMREEIQAELAEAFNDPDGLADAVIPLNGMQHIRGDYDPELGGITDTVVTYIGRGVFGGYEAKEIDGARILTTDVRLLVLQSELHNERGEMITPRVGDTINSYRALDVAQDPAAATWTIQLRK